MNKLKQKNKKSWIKYLDKMVSQYILKKHKTCQYCKRRPARHSHHIFSRRHMNTRFETDNLIALCGYCHLWIAHQDPELFRDFLIKKWFESEEKYNSLKLKASLTVKPDFRMWEIYLKTLCEK